jgi:type I restriction enzyme S subunit
MSMAREMKDSGIEWIGEIPTDWSIGFAFQIFTPVKNRNIGLLETNLLSLSYGKIKHKSINTTEGLLPESFDSYNIIECDDIVLRLTDLQNDHKSLRVGRSTERGIITSAYLTLRPSNNSFSQYMYYFLYSFDICKGLYGMGSGVRQGLNWDDIKHLQILLPTLAEQQRIAAFLDRKCAEIDSVIADTQKTIDEYKALKQSIITEAVTKGVRGERKMKDSGVEWIGDVPEEWKVIKCSRIISGTQNGLTRRDTEKSEGDIVLKLKNIDSNGYIDYSEVNRISLTAKEIETYELQEGDFLFVRVNGSKSLVGKCAIYHDIGSIVAYNDHIIRVQLNESCNHEYFKLYLQSNLGKCEIDLHTSTSAGQFTISGEGLRDMVFVLPPMKEQVEIVTHVSYSLSQTDAIIAAKQQLLAELDAYKKSVIYEYVTGKKEVQ